MVAPGAGNEKSARQLSATLTSGEALAEEPGDLRNWLGATYSHAGLVSRYKTVQALAAPTVRYYQHLARL